MRRRSSLLCAAGLAVAPLAAAADPADPSPSVETFEWSTVTRRARADRPGWLDELYRPWHDRGLKPGGGGGPTTST